MYVFYVNTVKLLYFIRLYNSFLSKPSRYETIVLPSGILFGAEVLVCNINECRDII